MFLYLNNGPEIVYITGKMAGTSHGIWNLFKSKMFI